MNNLNKINEEDVAIRPAQKKTRYRWVVALMIFLVYTVAAADRANLGMALPFIREEFTMSNTEAGALTSLFLLAYAIAQIPSGFIYSKFGVRSTFSVAMVATSVVTGLIGTAGSLFTLKAFRFLLGLAEGPLPLGMTSTINNWFPPKEKGTATGLFLSAAKFGPVLVPPLCAWIVMDFGWRYIFYFFAIPGIVLSVIWYILVKNRPSESKFVSEAELNYIEHGEDQTTSEEQVQSPKKEYKLVWLDKLIRATKANPLETKKEIFRSWDIWGAALGYFFMVGVVNVLLAWIPTYLTTVKKFDIMDMGIVAAAPWTGAIVGNMVGGWLSDKIINKRRKPNMMFTAFVSIFMMYSLINAPNNPYILAALMFVLGIFLNIGYSTYMVYPMGLTNKKSYPIACSVVNFSGQLGGAAAPLIAGIMLDHFSWNAVWIYLAVSCLLCLIVLFTIKEPVEDPLV
ncbi:MFS transporter [Aeribacillus sp. FSL M8-0235]|uniref:MFS transporter n=1 Tax=Aeribacillus sp. FSL M8-0235 TaxID=2954576 RepID=UPI0030F5C68B